MRLRPEDLPRHLKQALKPAYLIAGDEPLLVQEAADRVRAAARQAGYDERERLVVEPGFNWSSLAQIADSPSLFAQRRIIELRLETGKAGQEGAKALTAYAERPAPDALLLVVGGRFEMATWKTKWVKALERLGAVVQVWPVRPAELPGWLGRRMADRGLRPDRGAVQMLAERLEGNLLAAAQEVEKLAVLLGPGPVDADQVQAAVADSARFDVFDLAGAATAGDSARLVRVLAGLKGEGVEPVLVAWALTREARELYGLAREVAAGRDPQGLLDAHRIQRQRRPAMARALKRHGPHHFRRALTAMAQADRVCKGAAPGEPWEALLAGALTLAGAPPVLTGPDSGHPPSVAS